jgi:hypothetical protein
MEVLHNMGLKEKQDKKAAEKAAQEPTVTKFIDTSKTAEVYDKVQRLAQFGWLIRAWACSPVAVRTATRPHPAQHLQLDGGHLDG